VCVPIDVREVYLTGGAVGIDDLPLPVVNFLNVIGVPWPYIDEDTLLHIADLTRHFGSAVQSTHQEATRAVAGLAEAHESESTQALIAGWARLTADHVDALVSGCQLLAGALEMAAGYIMARKVEAIAILLGLVEAFLADQAAAVATAGLAEAALPVIVAGAQCVIRTLSVDLEQYLVAEVVEAAARPLLARLDAATASLDWPGSSGSVAITHVRVDPPAAAAGIVALRAQAAALRAHGEALRAGLHGLAF
jgi:hypothetical protein